MSGWISLTFDDGLPQHLDHVIPVLDRAELPGTFYAHLASPGFMFRQDEWRQAAKRGHELGNHTVFHPADARKSWVRPGNAIDDYSLDRMRLELEFANSVLETLDGHRERTFAYPCSNPCLGRRGYLRRAVERAGLGCTRLAGWIDRCRLDPGRTLRSYEPVIDEMFIAGRGGGLILGERVPPTTTWQRRRIPSAAVANASLREMQQHVTGGVETGAWVILQFHGVGGGHHMDCPLPVFRDFIGWLQAEHFGRVVTILSGARRLWPGLTAIESGASSAVNDARVTIRS